MPRASSQRPPTRPRLLGPRRRSTGSIGGARDLRQPRCLQCDARVQHGRSTETHPESSTPRRGRGAPVQRSHEGRVGGAVGRGDRAEHQRREERNAMGSLYRPALKSGGLGRISWCKYYVNGRPVRESTSRARRPRLLRILSRNHVKCQARADSSAGRAQPLQG